jgi:hypothetical protein
MKNEDATESNEPVEKRAPIAMEPKAAPPRRTIAHESFSLFIDFLKVTSWPLLALTFFLVFRHDIARTIALVPDKLERADKGNIGSLSWEIQQRAKEQGGSDLAHRIGTLSPAAIEELIKTPRRGMAGLLGSYPGVGGVRGYVMPSPQRLNGFRELGAAQLIRFTEPLDEWLKFVGSLPLTEDPVGTDSYSRALTIRTPLAAEVQRRIDGQDYELTPKGKQAVEAIVQVIGEQLR